MTLRLLFNEIRLGVKQICDRLGYPETEFDVAEASRPEFGDVSCNIGFLLAKALKKRPFDIAQTLAEEYNKNSKKYVLEVFAHNSGYLNFTSNYSLFVPEVIRASLLSDYGKVYLGKNSRMVVEHTSVNPNKALHVGHVRNIIIGDTIARILHKASYDVSVLNYVDDSGLQVADIIVGFKYGGFSDKAPEGQKFDHYCGDVVYVNMTERYETDKHLAELRSQVLKELEEGTSEIARFGDRITKRILMSSLKLAGVLVSHMTVLTLNHR